MRGQCIDLPPYTVPEAGPPTTTNEQSERWNREIILEHFLPISKQTPKPMAYLEC